MVDVSVLGESVLRDIAGGLYKWTWFSSRPWQSHCRPTGLAETSFLESGNPASSTFKVPKEQD